MLINLIRICFLTLITLLFSFQSGDFKTSQLKYSRVKSAYQKKWSDLQHLLESKQIPKEKFDLYIRVFKQEGILEAWAKKKESKTFVSLKSFKICAKSGSLGPKRRQGDGQVPEGFYEIVSFQPQSSYHLALKVGYPNKSDRLKAKAKDPGGDIMIHGNCVTIGCIPLQNEPIEELYVLCVEAKNKGSVIYTDIYPFRFNKKNQDLFNAASMDLKQFWNSLKPAYDYFELNLGLPKITTDSKGNYITTLPHS